LPENCSVLKSVSDPGWSPRTGPALTQCTRDAISSSARKPVNHSISAPYKPVVGRAPSPMLAIAIQTVEILYCSLSSCEQPMRVVDGEIPCTIARLTVSRTPVQCAPNASPNSGSHHRRHTNPHHRKDANKFPADHRCGGQQKRFPAFIPFAQDRIAVIERIKKLR
jgi:hypothetical protein